MIVFDHIAPKIVFQRDLTNKAVIPISGTANGSKLLIRFTPVQGGELVEKSLVIIDGYFSDNITVKAGDYELTAKTETETKIINRVGVGDVIAFWGHSFLQGGASTQNVTGNNSDLGRVLTATNVQNQNATPLQFDKITPTTKIGPFEGNCDFYGKLLDSLTTSLGVPVLLYNCCFGGSNIDQNYGVLNQIPFTHGFINYAQRMPFKPVEILFERYVPITGLKCLCIEHGLNDRNVNGGNDFKNQFEYILKYIRSNFNVQNLTYLLAKEGFNFAGNTIVKAQQSIIDTLPNTYKGMDFNNVSTWENPVANLLACNGHPCGQGLDQLAKDWNTGINQNLANCTPIAPKTVAPLVEPQMEAYLTAPEIAPETNIDENKSLFNPIVWVSIAILLLSLIAIDKPKKLDEKSHSKRLKTSQVGICIVIVLLLIKN